MSWFVDPAEEDAGVAKVDAGPADTGPADTGPADVGADTPDDASADAGGLAWLSWVWHRATSTSEDAGSGSRWRVGRAPSARRRRASAARGRLKQRERGVPVVVAMAKRAEDDEVRHVEICAELAARYGHRGGAVAPEPGEIGPRSAGSRERLLYEVVASAR